MVLEKFWNQISHLIPRSAKDHNIPPDSDLLQINRLLLLSEELSAVTELTAVSACYDAHDRIKMLNAGFCLSGSYSQRLDLGIFSSNAATAGVTDKTHMMWQGSQIVIMSDIADITIAI